MIRRIFFLFSLFLIVLQLQAQDTLKEYTLERVPNIHLQDKRFYVTDPSGILSASATDSVNTICSLLERQTGIEVAVVMLSSIGGNSPFDFGYQLFRKWGVGKKKNNNGLLVLFVADQHAIRFVTGYGIEGYLPDALCKRIQQRYMIPAFRQGDYSAGMVQGMTAVYQTLKDSMKQDSSNEGKISPWNYVFLVVAILLFILIPYLIKRRQERCPRCGKHTLKRTSSQVSVMSNHHRVQMDVYECKHCGYTTTRRKDLDDDGDDMHSGVGPFLGGFMGGSLLGGGFGRGGDGGGFSGGGSFGGGDTGGGGAGSNW